MSELKVGDYVKVENPNEINWDMPGYGVHTFHPKSSIEKIAIELVQLRLFILDDTNHFNYTAGDLQKLVDLKMDQLKTIVLESKTATHSIAAKNGLTQFVPDEIRLADRLLA